MVYLIMESNVMITIRYQRMVVILTAKRRNVLIKIKKEEERLTQVRYVLIKYVVMEYLIMRKSVMIIIR